MTFTHSSGPDNRPATVAIVAAVLSVAYLTVRLVLTRRSTSRALIRVPGPKPDSWLFGNMGGLPDDASLFLEESWFRKFGPTLKYHGFLSYPVLVTLDTTALKHILSHGEIYHKSEAIRWSLGTMMGHGLLFVEGGEHKKQRKIMNPAFGPMQVRRFTGLFTSKAKALVDTWTDLCAHSMRPDGRTKIDAFDWLNKVTLDIIGLAAFSYDIDSLHAPADKPNALNDAVRKIFSFDDMNFVAMSQLVLKPLRIIPTARQRGIAEAGLVIRKIGLEILADRKAAILASRGPVSESESPSKEDFEGSDLLTLLMKSNMAADLSESARMSDDDILSQIPTFLVAGHETTSTAVAWALFAMSCSPSVQDRLRAELQSLPTDTPSEAELNSFNYLDKVVRETFRLYGPVYSTVRTAMQDDVVPLSKPYIDVDGIVRHELYLKKGDRVNIPIMTIQRNPDIWGDDAHEFRPERWDNLPEAVKDLPSAWGNLMTFIAGSHACIGYRFAIIEMKALLYAIVRNFEFELGVSPADIMGRTSVVTRPSIVSNPAGGPQLPLVIRPLK